MHSPLLSSFLVDLFQTHGYGVEDVSITNDSAGCMLHSLRVSNGEDSACDTEEQNGHHLKIRPRSGVDALALASVVLVEVEKGVSRWESVNSGGIAARPAKNTERERSSVAVVIPPRGPRRPSNAGIPLRKTSSDSRTRLPAFMPERKESVENFSACPRGPSSAGIPLRKTSSDSRTRLPAFMPERKESMENFSFCPRGPSSAGILTRKTSSDLRTRHSPSLPKRKESTDNFSVYNARKSPEQKTCSFENLNKAKNASAIARTILFDQNSNSY